MKRYSEKAEICENEKVLKDWIIFLNSFFVNEINFLSFDNWKLWFKWMFKFLKESQSILTSLTQLLRIIIS